MMTKSDLKEQNDLRKDSKQVMGPEKNKKPKFLRK